MTEKTLREEVRDIREQVIVLATQQKWIVRGMLGLLAAIASPKFGGPDPSHVAQVIQQLI